MTKVAKQIISLWLVLQILVSSVGFTLIERKCSMADAKQSKEVCCKPTPTPKKALSTSQKPSCCSKKTFEEIFEEEVQVPENKQSSTKPCCNDESDEHTCCSFDAAYHHIAFKNYSLSTKNHELKHKKQSTDFVSIQETHFYEWVSLAIHAPPKPVSPPSKPSKTLLSLYAIFLI